MEANHKTLILLLFPLFPTADHQEAFDNLLRTARLIMSREFLRTLSPEMRSRPLNHRHAWIRLEAGADSEASVAIFQWIESEALLEVASSLGTLDDRVLEARAARKVLVVPDKLWSEIAVPCGADIDETIRVTKYPGMGVDKTPVHKPLLLLRQRLNYGLEEAVALGTYLGTRERKRAPSSMYLPQVGFDPTGDMPNTTGPPETSRQIGVPSKPARDDETTREVTTGLHAMPLARPRRTSSSGAIEVRRLSSGPPDPRCEDEDRRDTIEPPSFTAVPDREDPTEPKC